jgi:hypothetical protein
MITRSSEKNIQISSGTLIKAVLIVLAFAAFYYLRDVVLVVLLERSICVHQKLIYQID